MICSINILSGSVGTDYNPIDIFTVGNLTEAGIQPGSTCTVEGCYQYVYRYDYEEIAIMVLTPRDFCTVQGEIKKTYLNNNN